MIDGVKLRIQGRDQVRLRAHDLLPWRANGLDKRGRERFIAEWQGFTFKGDATTCTFVRGSIHKFHQAGENWAVFTFTDFATAVETLCLTLGLHPGNLRLANLEFGVNIEPPITTEEVLRRMLFHRMSPARPMDDTPFGITINHPDTPANRRTHGSDYRFKIYDKALHMGRAGRILRIELCVRKMRLLKHCQVVTLADLLDPNTWTALQIHLLKRFDELLIVEVDVPLIGLRPAEQSLLASATSTTYWLGLNRRQRSAKRAMLTRIYARQSSPPLKETLVNLIAAQAKQLNNESIGVVTADHGTFAPTVGPGFTYPDKSHNGQMHPLPQGVRTSEESE